MTESFRILFVSVLGAWIAALVIGIVGISRLARRRGRDIAWPAIHTPAPLVDLFGAWAGVLAAGALPLGRVGCAWPWAAALGLVALMVTCSLYDRPCCCRRSTPP